MVTVAHERVGCEATNIIRTNSFFFDFRSVEQKYPQLFEIWNSNLDHNIIKLTVFYFKPSIEILNGMVFVHIICLDLWVLS